MTSTPLLLPPLLALALSCAAQGGHPRPSDDAGRRPRIVGYLASWGVLTKGTRIAELPADQLTHIVYAFARIADDGRMVLGDPCVDVGECGARGDSATVARGGNFAELRRLKARRPQLQLLISVGGWGGSARFSDVALTEQSRRRFVESAVDFFLRRQGGLFDGIDVDWEFPVAGGMPGNVERADDRRNFTLLLGEFRRQLDEQGARDGRRYRLAIAASARPREIANLELGRITPLLDFVNVMTYDYHSGSPIAHFNAPLYAAANDPTPSLTVDASVRAYRDAGVPAEKILVGVPFYGRAYGGVPNVNGGLFQPARGLPAGWREVDGDYRALKRERLGDGGYRRFWHDEARVPWLYDSLSGTWITYDDEQSAAAKADYVREHGLGGVVIWELGGDDDGGALVRTLHEHLWPRHR